MAGMKVSVSLPDDDVTFVDHYAQANGTTRSAAVHEAIQALRRRNLADEYTAAHDEWTTSGEADIWDAVAPDGLR
jgi:metal-responsive CopG/Arc/MetJ family transcriptional regulator